MKSDTDQNSSLIGCVRLSAIGDVIMLARSIWMLHKEGHIPVLITRPVPAQIGQRFAGLTHMLVQNESRWQFFLRSINEPGSRWQEQPQEALEDLVQRMTVILDFQNTKRSSRALQELRKLGLKTAIQEAVSKSRLSRALLILKNRLRRQSLNSHLALKDFRPKDSHRVLLSHNDLLNRCLIRLNPSSNHAFNILNSTRDVTLVESSPLEAPNNLFDVDGCPLPHFPDVVLFPGASLPLKAWPLENCETFAKQLLAQGRTVVVLGGPDELEFAQALLSRCDGLQIAVGNLNLDQSADVLERARVVVTTDSFPAHLRDLCQKTTFVLFGATSPFLGFAPLSKKVHSLSLHLPCSPCTRHGSGRCRFGNHACMASIGGDTVAQLVTHALTENTELSLSTPFPAFTT